VSNLLNPKFVTAVNTAGVKQVIPRHWLDHAVLGRGFRLPPSAPTSAKKKRTTETPDANPAPEATPPAAGDTTSESKEDQS
jgi:hypothetical protein